MPKRNGKRISVRQIRRDDATVLAAFAAEFEQHLNSLMPGRDISSPMTQEAFLRDAFGDSPAFQGLIAECDENPCGYLLYHLGYLTELAARTVQVTDLFASGAARRAGVGTALMRALIPIAQQAGATVICMSVWVLNHDARNFYAKLGAEFTDEEFMWWKQENWQL